MGFLDNQNIQWGIALIIILALIFVGYTYFTPVNPTSSVNLINTNERYENTEYSQNLQDRYIAEEDKLILQEEEIKVSSNTSDSSLYKLPDDRYISPDTKVTSNYLFDWNINPYKLTYYTWLETLTDMNRYLANNGDLNGQYLYWDGNKINSTDLNISPSDINYTLLDGLYLKLDQTIAQTITGGMPVFNVGLKASDVWATNIYDNIGQLAIDVSNGVIKNNSTGVQRIDWINGILWKDATTPAFNWLNLSIPTFSNGILTTSGGTGALALLNIGSGLDFNDVTNTLSSTGGTDTNCSISGSCSNIVYYNNPISDLNLGLYKLAFSVKTIIGDITGNARGTSATDVQAYRTSVSQVASGQYSNAFGNGNTASGSASSSIGSGNTSSNSQDSAIGFGNTASGVSSSAIGWGNASSGIQSSAFGNSTTASGFNTAVFGNGFSGASDDTSYLGNGSYFISVNSSGQAKTNADLNFSNKSAYSLTDTNTQRLCLSGVCHTSITSGGGTDTNDQTSGYRNSAGVFLVDQNLGGKSIYNGQDANIQRLCLNGACSTSIPTALQSSCNMYKTGGSFTVPASTFYTLPFNNELFDSLGECNTSTGVFTAQASGTYEVHATINWSNTDAGKLYLLSLYKNSAGWITQYDSPSGANTYTGQSISGVIELSANDTVSVVAWQNTAGNEAIIGSSQSVSNFSIVRVK